MKKFKKILVILLMLVLVFSMVGCSTKKDSKADDASTKDAAVEAAEEAENFGKPIEFEVISVGDLQSNFKLQADLLLYEKGYFIWDGQDGFNYMLISSGEKPTSGYGLSVVSLGDYDGEFKLLVAEGNPPKDAKMPQILTYPHVVIKYASDVQVSTVLDEKGESFELINITKEK